MLIQIVDDNPNIRAAIRSILAGRGVEFLESANGEEAIGHYETNSPDVVLMDIRMDRMDGIAATRAIRAKDPRARIIIVTQYDDDDLREEARKAGASGYVLKDDLSELQSRIC